MRFIFIKEISGVVCCMNIDHIIGMLAEDGKTTTVGMVNNGKVETLETVESIYGRIETGKAMPE